MTAPAAATNEWAVKLRQAVRLPQIGFNFELNFNRLTGVVADEEVVDPVVEIERLNLARGGKIEDVPIQFRLFRLALLTGDTNQIATRRTEALAAWQAGAAAAPTNADALVGLGRILWLTGDEAAAEPLLRRAVEAAFAARLSRLFPDPANALDETDANHAVLLAALVSQALDGEVTIPKQVLRSALSANPADDYALTVLELIRMAPVESK